MCQSWNTKAIEDRTPRAIFGMWDEFREGKHKLLCAFFLDVHHPPCGACLVRRKTLPLILTLKSSLSTLKQYERAYPRIFRRDRGPPFQTRKYLLSAPHFVYSTSAHDQVLGGDLDCGYGFAVLIVEERGRVSW